MLLKLVKRLPVMICPKWTQTFSTPVDLETVVSSLTLATTNLSLVGKVYDLAGCAPLTYMEMMNLTAKRMGLRRVFWSVPFFTPTLSRLWVSLITNSPKSLVYPLIESLEHPMLARPSHLFSKEGLTRTYGELLKNASFKSLSGRSFLRFEARRKTVRSVQRLSLPEGKNAEWVKEQYLEWLPQFLAPLIVVKREGSSIVFSVFGSRLNVLEMRFSDERSDGDRQLLYVTKGLLVSKKNRGRLEFRVVLNRQFVLAAIHDFRPSLPWFLYKFTQAKLHLFVMNAFARHLEARGSSK
jgi:hypothetical protein